MMERLYEEEMACRKKARITESSSDRSGVVLGGAWDVQLGA